MRSTKLYGGIEAGGTKFVCGIGSGSGELLARRVIEATTPEQTLAIAIDFFTTHNSLQAIGIGTFGPVNLDTASKQYGTILNTPKPGWSGINLKKYIGSALKLPVNIATDTDVAAIGELYHGKATGNESFIYLTIGTGIGGSAMEAGQLLHGISHPEMGHILVAPLPEHAEQGGACLFHKYCLEGFASGSAIEKLYGAKAETITDETVWRKVAYYLAQGITDITVVTRPNKIILGGSVVLHTGLLQQVRTLVIQDLNNYIETPKPDDFIVHSSSDSIGVLGAIKLATLP